MTQSVEWLHDETEKTEFHLKSLYNQFQLCVYDSGLITF